MAILRNLTLGLFRLNGIHKIKEATEGPQSGPLKIKVEV